MQNPEGKGRTTADAGRVPVGHRRQLEEVAADYQLQAS